MSINRSQSFLYLQNKCQHYTNLNKAKPFVKNHLQKCYVNKLSQKINKSTLDYYKDQNFKFGKRLIEINQSKSQLQKNPQYSRNNNFQRNFRLLNPYKKKLKDDQKRQNSIYFDKIEHIKPKIGSKKEWAQQYEKKQSYRQTAGKYRGNVFKNSLHISTDNYMPQSIRNFVTIQLGQKLSKQIIISPQKMFILPKIKRTIQQDLKSQDSFCI